MGAEDIWASRLRRKSAGDGRISSPSVIQAQVPVDIGSCSVHAFALIVLHETQNIKERRPFVVDARGKGTSLNEQARRTHTECVGARGLAQCSDHSREPAVARL